MRVTKLVLFAAALIVSSSSAYALEVKKRIEAPGNPPDIWEFVGDFCSIKDWHPVVADCKQVTEGNDTFRILSLKGGGTIKEKLTGQEGNTGYDYEIVESPLPVKNYKAKFWVEPDDEPDRSAIYWQAEFDANGASDDEATKKITDIFSAGLKNIKKMAIEKAGSDNGSGGGGD